jgi:hypothetical protein
MYAKSTAVSCPGCPGRHVPELLQQHQLRAHPCHLEFAVGQLTYLKFAACACADLTGKAFVCSSLAQTNCIRQCHMVPQQAVDQNLVALQMNLPLPPAVVHLTLSQPPSQPLRHPAVSRHWGSPNLCHGVASLTSLQMYHAWSEAAATAYTIHVFGLAVSHAACHHSAFLDWSRKHPLPEDLDAPALQKLLLDMPLSRTVWELLYAYLYEVPAAGLFTVHTAARSPVASASAVERNDLVGLLVSHARSLGDNILASVLVLYGFRRIGKSYSIPWAHVEAVQELTEGERCRYILVGGSTCQQPLIFGCQQ